MLFTLFKGFITGAGLIMAIGAQNAFVIRQGLLRNHLFLTALICSLVDAFLIVLGVLGFGKILALYPIVISLAKFFAVIFLFIYGAFSLKSAFRERSVSGSGELTSLRGTVLMLLGLSLFNPHVYLDTVILLGSIAAQVPASLQCYFTLGAIVASFSWFFSLTYGSKLLSRFLQNPKIWQYIDVLIALMMWAIALMLMNLSL